MDIVFTNLGLSSSPDINDPVNASSYLTPSWSPPVTGVILCAVHSRRSGGPDTPTISGNSLTWIQIGSTLDDNDDGGLSLFIADANGASTGQTTIDFGANTQVHCAAMFCQVEYVDIIGGAANAVVQNQTNTGSSDTTGSVTLSAPGSSNNRPFAFFWHFAQETTTPRTNWTELDDFSGSGRTRGIETQYRPDAFETSVSASWVTTANWAGFAIELKAAAGPDLDIGNLSQLNSIETPDIDPSNAITISNLSQSNSIGTFTLVQSHVLSIANLSALNHIDATYAWSWWKEIHESVGLVSITHSVVGYVKLLHEEYGFMDMEHDENAYIDQQVDGDGEIAQEWGQDAPIATTHEQDGEL